MLRKSLSETEKLSVAFRCRQGQAEQIDASLGAFQRFPALSDFLRPLSSDLPANEGRRI